MPDVKPLKARIHTLNQLQLETLDLIRKVRFQLQHQAHQSGLNDTEFLDQIVQPLEDKIYQDREMAKMLRQAKSCQRPAFSGPEGKTMTTETVNNDGSAATDSSTLFTPGPWKVVRSQTCGHLRAEHNYHSDPHKEWTDADMSLIEAAPDMLEVLREVALPPYPDSDVSSLLETLRARATAVLDAIESE